MYAVKYSKEICADIGDACSEFAWDYLADFIHISYQTMLITTDL